MRLLVSGTQGSDSKENPFVPGHGGMPPHLAGRDQERSVLRGHLTRLAAKRSPGTNVILYGPRGNGKTVLLLSAVREARELGIHVIRMPASVGGLREALRVELSLLPSWGRGFLRRLGGLSASGFGVRMRDSEGDTLLQMLSRKARRVPLLVALDEAHQMDPILGRDLLNDMQHVQGDDGPVMLLLAGTPDLPRHLNSMQASFWGRSQRLPIGRLGPGDSASAVSVPFEQAGRSIETDALGAVVRESHGYPYFLQLWGKALWEACRTPSNPISLDDVDRVRPQFRWQRDLYYEDRYEELKRLNLLTVAAVVAEVFAEAETRIPGEVEAAVEAALARSGRATDNDRGAVADVLDRLRDLGYIWNVIHRSGPRYEPGIPSLMRFVARAANSDDLAGG